MKKFILSIILVLAMAGMANAQVQSLLQGATGPGGKMVGSSTYFATGADDQTGINYETQALSSYNLNGEFPKIIVYKAGAGAYESETLIEMQQGSMSTLEKVGSSTLVTFPDENDPSRINGILTQSAVGTETGMLGQANFGSQFGTAGGLVMNTQVQFLGESGKWNVGAIQQVTEGFGPAPGQVGEVGSQITVRWEEHVRFGGFSPGGAVPFAGSYAVSMNPGVQLLTKP